MRNRIQSELLVIAGISGFLCYFSLAPVITCTVLYACVLFCFYARLGSEIVERELAVALIGLAYIVAPACGYYLIDEPHGFEMQVTPAEYFSVLGVYYSLLLIGLFVPISSTSTLPNMAAISDIAKSQGGRVGYLCVAIGFCSIIMGRYAPGSTQFIFYLGSQLRFIGIIYLIMSRDQRQLIAAFACYLLFVFQSILGGLFYDLLAWTAFFVVYGAVLLKPSNKARLAATVVVAFSLLVLQAAKHDYRDATWRRNEVQSRVQKLVLFSKICVGAIPKACTEESATGLLTRINQGWIFSRVLKTVPRLAPHENGDLIAGDIGSAFLPRFLFPNKKESGGRANQRKFTRYTGRRLVGSTTMRVGAFSDAYIDGGMAYGAAVVLVIGLIFNGISTAFRVVSIKFPAAILWLPFVFSYLIRFSDIQVIANFAVKGLVAFMFLGYFWRRQRTRRTQLNSNLSNSPVV